MIDIIYNSLLKTVYFGPQGFQLITSKIEQKTLQKKFSTKPSWNDCWFVIGIDTELGDPYLINNSHDNPCVYTALFDGDKWRLVPVAISINAFLQCLTLLNNASKQTSEVYVPQSNTLVVRQQIKSLEEELIHVSKCQEFWQHFFICYLDWVAD